jgi:hypothetical protein
LRLGILLVVLAAQDLEQKFGLFVSLPQCLQLIILIS